MRWPARSLSKKNTSAHRASWTLHRGPIPDGMQVLHRYDDRACVRPDHLFLGTQLENIADMVAKGRAGNRFTVSRRKAA